MIHIVFNEADVRILQAAIELDESMQGEVVQIKDDWAVGPLDNIYAAEGIDARKQWWRDVLAGGDGEGLFHPEAEDDYQTMAHLATLLNENPEEKIWIWAAQNSHDVCGYYWMLPFMKEFQRRVYILYLNNLPFINEKGNIFYPTKLSEIQPKEFLKAKKLAREITLSEFEVDPDEWTKIASENKGVRILEGGKKLVQFEYDYFDAELKKYIMPDFQKASKIIHNCINKSKHTTGDLYLLWRLKVMIAMDMFDVQGKLEKMKDFDVKYKSKSEPDTTTL